MQKITYGIHKLAYGNVILAITNGKLIWLGFDKSSYKGSCKALMKKYFARAFTSFELEQSDKAIQPMVSLVNKALSNNENLLQFINQNTELYGSDFQKAVWKSLCAIPQGSVVSYKEIANDIGTPKALRAVGSAVGANPLSVLIPCHRVIPSLGGIGNYLWGQEVKHLILKSEGIQTDSL